MCPTAPLREECLLHPTQIANVRPDIPMGEKPVENDLSQELTHSGFFVCLFVCFLHSFNLHRLSQACY